MPLKKYLVVGDEETSPLVVIQQHGVAARECLMSKSDSEGDRALALRDYPESLHAGLRVLRPKRATSDEYEETAPRSPTTSALPRSAAGAGVAADDGLRAAVEVPHAEPRADQREPKDDGEAVEAPTPDPTAKKSNKGDRR